MDKQSYGRKNISTHAPYTEGDAIFQDNGSKVM